MIEFPIPHVRGVVRSHTYRDSVEMMRLASQVEALPGVIRAAALMGTAANRAMMVEAGLAFEGLAAALADDLVLAVSASDAAAADAALTTAESLLKQQPIATDSSGEVVGIPPRSIHHALSLLPGANLAIISVPGAYAAAEALKAIKYGLNVFLFSDNVSLDDEIRLKRLAHERGLLVMGPDCGTAIINGVPLGFANAVRRGRIGVVGASGTGLQEVTCLIDRLGEGISQAIGVGGRDLTSAVEAMMTIDALSLLENDPSTEVIALVSKPPSASIADRVLGVAGQIRKPVVVCFVGAGIDPACRARPILVQTLEEAAVVAVALAQRSLRADIATHIQTPASSVRQAASIASRLSELQVQVRGLYSGGTFTSESSTILASSLGYVSKVETGEPTSVAHSAVVDLGADAFTVGRPHPMIDARLRNDWIVATAADVRVAVILLDVVLGYGAHPDPAGALVQAIVEARCVAENSGREIAFVASVCGVPADPQRLESQRTTLIEAGVILAPSNAAATRLAGAIATRTVAESSAAHV